MSLIADLIVDTDPGRKRERHRRYGEHDRSRRMVSHTTFELAPVNNNWIAVDGLSGLRRLKAAFRNGKIKFVDIQRLRRFLGENRTNKKKTKREKGE
jgi:hypothetical protein